MNETHDPLVEALRAQTRSDECPAPEVFLAAEWAALEPDAAAGIAAHVETCAACRAERRLAQAFDAPAEADDLGRRRLRKALDRADIGVELATRPGRRGGVLPMVGTAAVLGMATAVLYFVLGQNTVAPPPPTLRGAAIELIAPQATQPAPVTRFEWQRRDGAARYEVVVKAADGSAVLTRTTAESTLVLTDETAAWQRPGTAYHWQVEAFDADGRRIGVSRPARFRTAPNAEE